MKKLLLLIGFASLTINAQVPSYVPNNGLLAYYPFNSNANDLSGNNLNGTLNGPSLTSDRFGNSNSAYNYNGTSNNIVVLNSSILNVENWSVSAWYKTSVNSNTIQRITTKQTGSVGNSNVFAILFQNGKVYGSFYNGSTEVRTSDNSITSDGNWHHVVYIRNQNLNKLYIYVDNVLKDSTTNSFGNLANTANLFIGSSGASTDIQWWNGKIDDIGIWNRALTQDEITSLFNSQSLCQSLSFSDLNNMPTNRGLIASATDGSNIYICNGFSPTVGYTTQIEKYNIATNAWSTLSNTNTGLRYSSAEVVGNKLYVFNGISSSTTFNDKMEIVDLTTGIVTFSTNNPSPVYSAGSSVWNGKIYSFGGTSSAGKSAKLYVFDPILQTWTQLANMPQAKEAKGEIINGKLYVIGGFNSAMPNYSTSIDCYDIQTNTWSHMMDMPASNSANATSAYQNKIWVVGDYDNLTFVGYYDVLTNQFVSIQSNIIARRHAGTIALNNNVYAFGGNQTSLASSSLNSLQVANITNFTNVPNVGYTTPQSYEVGTAIIPLTPINTSGSCSLTYSISPALPSGLTLDTATGIISGTPAVTLPVSSYSITACNNSVCVTSTLVLSIATLGTAEFTNTSLKLYPNPTHSIINIQTSNSVVLDKISITDLTGKTVMEQTQNTNQVSVEKLASGVYILNGYSEGNKLRVKFIKK